MPLLEGVLQQMFLLGQHDHFFVYQTATSYRLPDSLPPHVQCRVLGEVTFWCDLDRAAAQDRIEVLFRCYPSDETIAFPMRRQIVLVPDLQHEDMPEFFDAEVLARRQVAFAQAIGNAGALAVLSEYGRTTLLARYPQLQADVFLMPPASTLHRDDLDQPLSQEEQAALPPQPFFFFPANLWPHKNHRTLFRALEIMHQQHGQPVALVLTGDPTGWPELQANCMGLPVSHLGFVSRRLLAELYRRAGALVYFSRYEGFGIPLLEAFAMGTPVLCGNTTSLPEIGGDAVLSCDPLDAPAIAALMARILDDDELRSQLVERGRQQLDRYTWRRPAQNLLDACGRVAATPIDHPALLAALDISSERLHASETDRVARLADIHQLNNDLRQVQAQLAASEADRVARQGIIDRLTADLAASEADRAARLELIHQQDDQVGRLRVQLAESEADRAAQIEATRPLQAQLAASEADRAARLDTILRQEAMIYKLRSDLSVAQSRLWMRVGRKIKRILVSAWQS